MGYTTFKIGYNIHTLGKFQQLEIIISWHFPINTRPRMREQGQKMNNLVISIMFTMFACSRNREPI